jgi:hypothetical protein
LLLLFSPHFLMPSPFLISHIVLVFLYSYFSFLIFPSFLLLLFFLSSVYRPSFLSSFSNSSLHIYKDRLCGLVVRVLGYRSGGPGSIPSTTRKKVVSLERGALSLVSTTEELLDRKVATPVKKTENTAVGIRHTDHVAPSIRKSWQSLRRQAAVAR